MTKTGVATTAVLAEEQAQVVNIPAEIAMAANREELQRKIEEISSNKLKELLAREAQIHKEIDDLSSVRRTEMNERRISALQTDLASVRAEIAKRGEDLASLSYAIAGEMEVFGRLSGEALQDSEEDIAKKTTAYKVIEDAQQHIIDAKADLKSANDALLELQTELQTAKESFIWGRKDRVANVTQAISRQDQKISNAEARVSDAENELLTAQENLPVVLEQVEVDKRNRIKEASLEETYATITKWVAQAKKILKDDIAEYGTRISETLTAKKTAVDRRVKAAERIKAATEKLEELNADFDGLKLQRGDITDRTSPEYQDLTRQMEDLSVELDAAKNEQKLAESGFTDAEIAVKERVQSLRSLTTQNELAKVQYNKFVLSEETAHYIGQNIVVLVKGTTRETLNESLDRGVGKMTVAVYDVSKKAEVASTKQLTDMARRKLEVLDIMEEMDADTDQALAVATAEYMKLAQQIRDGYARQGLDVENLSGLNAAAELVGQLTNTQHQSKITETELF